MTASTEVARLTKGVYIVAVSQVIGAIVEIVLDELTIVTTITGYAARSSHGHVSTYTFSLDHVFVEITHAEVPATAEEVAEMEGCIGNTVLEMSTIETSPFHITALEWNPNALEGESWTAICNADMVWATCFLVQAATRGREAFEEKLQVNSSLIHRRVPVKVTFRI